jgi:acyl carrier protein
MDEFLSEMAEILEEDTVGPQDELNSFESWDSLAALSVAALAESSFGVTLSGPDMKSATTVEDLYQRILAKKTS